MYFLFPHLKSTESTESTVSTLSLFNLVLFDLLNF